MEHLACKQNSKGIQLASRTWENNKDMDWGRSLDRTNGRQKKYN
jgi:hypothetical protein